MRRSAALALLTAGVLALTACSDAPGDDLQQWMTEQKSQTSPKLKPISEPKAFKPQAYVELTDLEPFSSQKLTSALKRDSAQAASNGALLEPELARRKEPLEEFPLDTITMVGSVMRNGQPIGLVTVGKLLYQVRAGDHLGQNYGRIISVQETELTLREIVQDATGEWVERSASLRLQEGSK